VEILVGQGQLPADPFVVQSGSEPAPPERAGSSAEIQLPATESSVRIARKFTEGVLAEWAIGGEPADDAVLIVSELLTNAIVHGDPPIGLRLHRATGELTIDVDDGSSVMPRRLRPAPDEPHGRGVAIVAQLSRRWAARPHGRGKTVRCTITTPG
jgi:anti-sigma regulatory factor (Ser/Thr protein kinase)